MKKNIIKIPEPITGLRSSYELSLSDDYRELMHDLNQIFSTNSKCGPIRKPYAKPSNDSIFDLEDWQFNEELTKISWENLSIDNAMTMLANYSSLFVEEKLSFQPFLWKYILCSNEWNSAFSSVILSFLTDADSLTPTIKDVCAEDQKQIILRCLRIAQDRILSKVINVEKELIDSEEIEQLQKVIDLWEEKNGVKERQRTGSERQRTGSNLDC